jgi:alkylation response protein AidB-like acyl-CoA dehydrogenase
MSADTTLEVEDFTAQACSGALVSPIDLSALRESVADLLSAECGRRAVHLFIDGENALDRTLWTQAAELGWLAIGLPEAYGGLGFGEQGLDVLHRELGRWLAPGPFISTLSAASWLSNVGGEAERQAYLPRISAGELTVAIPADLRRPPSLKSVEGRVSGRSALLLGSADAGLAIVPIGRADGAAAWALIETDTSDAQLAAQPTWDRTRQMCVLSCDGAKPAAVIEDAEGDAAVALNRQIALAAASDSIGGAGAVSAQTIEYMKTRVQFDRPIGAFQAMKHRAADLMILIATQENLLDQGVEAAQRRSPHADMWAALAKAGVTSTYRFIADDCVLLHGGIGFTWEYDCHMFLKRARLNETLGMSNPDLYDLAAAALSRASADHRSTAELDQ